MLEHFISDVATCNLSTAIAETDVLTQGYVLGADLIVTPAGDIQSYKIRAGNLFDSKKRACLERLVKSLRLPQVNSERLNPVSMDIEIPSRDFLLSQRHRTSLTQVKVVNSGARKEIIKVLVNSLSRFERGVFYQNSSYNFMASNYHVSFSITTDGLVDMDSVSIRVLPETGQVNGGRLDPGDKMFRKVLEEMKFPLAIFDGSLKDGNSKNVTLEFFLQGQAGSFL